MRDNESPLVFISEPTHPGAQVKKKLSFMAKIRFETVEQLQEKIGEEIAEGYWYPVTQEQINLFAEAGGGGATDLAGDYRGGRQ